MVILAQLQRLFTPRPDKREAQHLYIALVAQARNPVFYESLAVPDSLDGRFEMITLHMFLILERVKTGFERHVDWRELSRLLIETYLADMDRSLREMGAGDTGIARRVQAMASGFYGRMDAYRKAGTDNQAWQEALRRNVYGTSDVFCGRETQALADYCLASQALLAQMDDDAIRHSRLLFASIN